MNRLQKKCLISAAGFHLLLLLILFVGPAFLSSHKSDPDSVITMITLDTKLTDGPSKGGGTPNAKPPPPAPPTPPAPQPQATPPEPPPKPPEQTKSLLEKLFEPTPPKEDKIEKPNPEALLPLKKVVIKKHDTADPSSETSKLKIDPKDLKLVKKTLKPKSAAPDTSEADARAEAKAQARAAAARQQAFSHSLQTLQNNLSSGTDVTVPGPGGAAFANYRDAVRIAYMDAWIAPTEAADDKATTTVSVTIARDGTVISARIKTPSGDPATDRSVDQTLRRVKSIAPFPEGATDSERTFIIKFDLTKKLLG